MINKFPEIEHFFNTKDSYSEEKIKAFKLRLRTLYSDDRIYKKALELFALKSLSHKMGPSKEKKEKKKKVVARHIARELGVELKTLVKYSRSHLKLDVKFKSKLNEEDVKVIKGFFVNVYPEILKNKRKKEQERKKRIQLKRELNDLEKVSNSYLYDLEDLYKIFSKRSAHYFDDLFNQGFPDYSEFEKAFRVEKSSVTKARLLVKSYFKRNQLIKGSLKKDDLGVLQSEESILEPLVSALPITRKLSSSIDELTNEELYGICRGLKDNKARKLANLYFEKGVHEDFDLAKRFAFESIEKYGLDKLKYLISLPPKPIDASEFVQVFDEMDKKAAKSDLPIVRFNGRFDTGKKEAFEIYYLSDIRDGDKKRTRYNNVLVLRNRKTKKEVLKLTRDGRIVPSGKSKKIYAELEMFLTFCKNSRQMILNYGLETGFCSICGRPLTDSKSIKRGVGPVCYESL